MSNRNKIILLNPSNSFRYRQSTFIKAIYPNLGLLTLGAGLRAKIESNPGLLELEVFYYDGALHANEWICEYIQDNHQEILVIGISTCTYNYAACIEIAELAKGVDSNLTIIFGNDHFSALYQEAMRKRERVIDFGFYGNDVVEGFSNFVCDLFEGTITDLGLYPGLVYRDLNDSMLIQRNPEDPDEYARLPLVDYSLIDSLIPHTDEYLAEQRLNYPYMRENGYKTTVIDIARGCVKFAGRRNEKGIPLNACSFCAIIPGSKALLSHQAEKAWMVIQNAFEQGYNYYFTSADELPATFWPMLKKMIECEPDWYRRLPKEERPKILCYARADGLQEKNGERLNLLMDRLGLDHFNLGLDAFTQLSPKAMNKGINEKANSGNELLEINIGACEAISARGGRITTGIVVTHFGITPELLEANFQVLKNLIESRKHLFIEIGFELLCPLPGSHAFELMKNPDQAQKKADMLGLEINMNFLQEWAEKNKNEDLFDGEELVQDFVKGCCPKITLDLAYEYLNKYKELIEEYDITWESTSPV